MSSKSPTFHRYTYKRLPCRHFDDKGGVLDPPCPQGDSCRFAHPEDNHWKTAIATSKDRRLSSAANSRARRGDTNVRYTSAVDIELGTNARRTPDLGSPSSKKSSNPLVPQAALFQRTKVETEDEWPIHHRDHRSRDEDRAHLPERPRDCTPRPHWDNGDRNRASDTHVSGLPRTYANRSNEDILENPSVQSKRIKETSAIWNSLISSEEHRDREPTPRTERTIERSAQDIEADGYARKDHPYTTVHRIQSSQGVPRQQHADVIRVAAENGRAHRHEASFRDLGRLCSMAFEDAAARDREERKLQAYTELSSSLSKVSPVGSTVVASKLAEVFLSHAEYKQRAERSNEVLANAWETIFRDLSADINRTIGDELRKALAQLHRERMIFRDDHSDTTGSKRKAGGGSSSRSEQRRTGSHGGAQKGHKQRDIGDHEGDDGPRGQRPKRRRTDVSSPASMQIKSEADTTTHVL
ncbi:hypothetical protein HGRIS_013082 [Hohenbuehelia grisea]|uniref:C3H1-type domain-containing protein n=1 Tax=Hohenbuehelia grisea TaxID=104357 RepID=A0ABR3IUA9_9AGAR